MKIQSHKLVLVALCAVVIGLVGGLQVLTRRWDGFDLFQRLEWMSYDWRVRLATNSAMVCAPNLGFVYIDNDTIAEVLSGSLGYSAGLYWPRHVYGHVIQELDRQGAEAVGFDTLFGELRPDHPKFIQPGGKPVQSDEFFAEQVRHARNVILAAEKGSVPPDSFRTNAFAVGNITSERDSDGILRQTKAFEDYLIIHPMIREGMRKFDGFVFETNRILFPIADKPPLWIPIEPDGNFNAGALYEVSMGHAMPTNLPSMAKAYTRMRAWDLGLVLAARHLRMDLSTARVEPGEAIHLRSAVTGRERVIPIDAENRFYIDWSVTFADPRLTKESFHSLLDQDHRRQNGQPVSGEFRWRGKLAVIGSVASGNDLSDIGATPLERETFLTTRYWNIANSLILGRFIQRPSLATELYLILTLGLISGIISWNLRAMFAGLSVLLLGVAYVAIGIYLYLQVRYWLPLVLPCGVLFLAHFTLVTYRVVFEQRERSRLRDIFAKIVSPNVVTELLQADKLSLGGARRQVTVFFSDVRGFTEMTDESHARAEAFVKEKGLTGLDAEAYFDRTAQEMLNTVNLYLGIIADTVKKHEGTLDKYIGDCVMAFWGAPTPNDSHALSCVRAAMDAQRAIYAFNVDRAAENIRREEENMLRVQQGLEPLPLFELLSMGSGINTGVVTVGLMGSEQHTINYTVFGRDVNLASRLEGLSGRGRILIGEATFHALRRLEPALAETCVPLLPANVKGFRTPVNIFEVPWKTSPALKLIVTTPDSTPSALPDTAHHTKAAA